VELIQYFKGLFEQGSKLGGEVGTFFSYVGSYFIGTLIFLIILYGMRRIPLIRAIREYALLESSVDREQSEFIRMFRSPVTRVRINVCIMIGLIMLLLLYAFMVFVTVSFPFMVWAKGVQVSIFGIAMICLLVTAIELWVIRLLIRFNEQTARAIRIDRELHT